MANEMSLHQIDDMILSVRRRFEDMNVDIDEQTLKDTLDSLADAKADKIDSLAGWSDSLESQNDWIDKKLKDLASMKKRNNHLLDWINGYIADSLKSDNRKKLQTENHMITTRTSSRVVIDDESKLPKAFFKPVEQPKPKPDKAKLRKALKAEDTADGGTITGAHLEKNIKAVIK